MLYWSAVFLLVALIAGVLGFSGIAGFAAAIARWTFVLFLFLLVLSLAGELLRTLAEPRDDTGTRRRDG